MDKQKLYEIISDVKGLDAEFNDIDEEIVRISEYNESITDKNSARALKKGEQNAIYY